MVSKPGWLKDSIAKEDGYYTADGSEKLKSRRLTSEEIAEWNGTASQPEVLIEAEPSPGVETTLIEAEPELDDLTKKELEELGREYGVELDRREKKTTLVEKLKTLIER